ncbi:helix-turn-helix domain-containing protein [Streptomyces sp. NBC_01017]|uniref:helix-turn-helix domain-containing protein n=1 Tax=Streptomyces sp. NBC_01017 TaxID=2903721 RepID=UPI00386CFF68|nr:helix-turn-helix domain-containing protein [Streptomyces sp. NBC_01017]WSV35083.1 helix-turn-helix domain-containing protein [Streptomyces sp. NBC_01017]
MGSQKKYPVRLTARDREELVRVTTTGVRRASMIMRARVLLALDTSVGEVDSKEVIATRLGVSGETLRLVAKRFTETGGDVHATIARKKRDLPPVPSPVTGEVEARLIAMACSLSPRAMRGGPCGYWRSTWHSSTTSLIWTTPPSAGS